MSVKVQDGEFYLYAPWGGKCIAHFENNCLWMHRYTGPYAFGFKGNGIWKCQSAQDTERLIRGSDYGEEAVWVLWDNQDWKRMKYDPEVGDFYVQHGEAWHPFWSVGMRKIREGNITKSNAEAREITCPSVENSDSMMVDNSNDGWNEGAREGTMDPMLAIGGIDISVPNTDVGHTVGKKRCSFDDHTSSQLNDNRKRYKRELFGIHQTYTLK